MPSTPKGEIVSVLGEYFINGDIDPKLQVAGLRSFENFGDGKGIKLQIHEENYPPAKIERVRQNMEKEDAIKYRANTNNRGYGFEQVLNKKEVPLRNGQTFRLTNSKSATMLNGPGGKGGLNQSRSTYNNVSIFTLLCSYYF